MNILVRPCGRTAVVDRESRGQPHQLMGEQVPAVDEPRASIIIRRVWSSSTGLLAAIRRAVTSSWSAASSRSVSGTAFGSAATYSRHHLRPGHRHRGLGRLMSSWTRSGGFKVLCIITKWSRGSRVCGGPSRAPRAARWATRNSDARPLAWVAGLCLCWATCRRRRCTGSCIHLAKAVISGRRSAGFVPYRIWTDARVNSAPAREKLAVYGVHANWRAGSSPYRWQHDLLDEARGLDAGAVAEEVEAFPVAGSSLGGVGDDDPPVRGQVSTSRSCKQAGGGMQGGAPDLECRPYRNSCPATLGDASGEGFQRPVITNARRL
jgi:hypothetical protein